MIRQKSSQLIPILNQATFIKKMAKQIKLKERKTKIFYNPEMEDLPFPEPLSYKLLVEAPQELEDINKAEGTKLTGIESGAMNLANHDSDDLAEGAINQYLLDNAVTELKLAALAVTEAKIAVNAITEAKVAADAITQNKIANAAIIASKIHDDYKILEIVTSLPGAGTAGRIAYLTTDGKIYRDNGSVWKEVILPSEVTNHLGGEGVGTIGSVKIDAGAITEAKLAASAVTETKIANNAITSPKIVAGAITAGKIVAGAVTTEKLNALAVTAEKIASNAITADKISANSVNTSELVAGSVTSTIIAASAVIAEKIASSAITAGKIASNAITAVKIQAGAVTTDKISANAVTSAKVTTGTLITLSAQIASAIINNAHIANLSADKITAGVLTGRKVQTATSGRRVVMETSGNYGNFIAYDTGGTMAGRMYGDSGNCMLVGWLDITANCGAFRPISGGGAMLGTSSYPWGTTYLGSVYSYSHYPRSSGSYHLGSTSYYWNNVYLYYLRFHGSYGRIYWGTDLVQDYYSDKIVHYKGLHSVTSPRQNLGDATYYWNEVNYKYLTDRGCLGVFDKGVELQDGRKVTDIEALKEIKKHPKLRTGYGVPRFDYSTMPKAVFKPAPIAKKAVYDERDKKKLLWKKGEKMGEDGAETTALISIMIGAVKELDNRIKNLEEK